MTDKLEEKPISEIPKDAPVSKQRRAETMAYSVQNIALSLGANLWEPYINYRVQRHYSDKDHPGGNYVQNLAGEFAGDIIGGGTLFLAEAVASKPLHAMTRTMRRCVDPLYTSVAHRVFAEEKGEPDYEKKVREWANFQERNLVLSLITGAAGIAGNVAIQKSPIIGNNSPTSVIFKGKLASTAVTTALGLTTRLIFPSQMKSVDKWVGKNIFAPMIEDDPATHVDKVTKTNTGDSHER